MISSFALPFVLGACGAGICWLGEPCGGTCVVYDEDNCGGCGIRCARGATCFGGECRCPERMGVDRTTSPARPECVPIDGPLHCGEAGVECGSSAICANVSTDWIGEDRYECFTCAEPQPVACGNNCYDLSTDNEHCGACYDPCPSPGMCIDGACVSSSDAGL